MMPPTKDGILKFNTLRFPNAYITKSGRQITAPANEDQSIVPETIKEKATALIRSVAPMLLSDGRSVDFWRACWDCGTVDRNMVLTTHPNPKLRNLYLAVGGSSHSWKFLPIIGRYVANTINGIGNGEKDPRWAWKYREAQEAAEPIAA
jgi:sarcosine oxidase/L-pipecolate oxidase